MALHKHWLILVTLAGIASGEALRAAEPAERNFMRLEHAVQVRSVAFSPDGSLLASGASDQKVCLWDARTGQKLKELGGRLGSVRSVVFAPDAKTLAAGSSDRAIVLYDVTTGQERNRWIAHRGWVTFLAFSPDGKSLLSRGEDGLVRLWDLAGHEVSSFGGHAAGAACAALSPDGKLLASGDRNNLVHIWETATGNELFQLAGHRSPVTQLAFSADGKTLASAAQENEIRLWEMATGAERCKLSDAEFMTFCLAFSPDGRVLAAGGMDRVVRFWDVATCRQLASLAGHTSTISALSFARDGGRLATGGQNGAVLIFDMTGPRPHRDVAMAALSAKELEKRWNDLAAEDAPRAFAAIWTLASAPGQALTFLKAHFHPDRPPDPASAKRIARLVGELDSDDFAIREKATKELETCGAMAVSPLENVLAGKPSAEVRHRVETLLGKVAPAKSRLRQLRVVEVLEHIGTRDARAMLEQIRQGASDREWSEDAKAALERLAKRGNAS